MVSTEGVCACHARTARVTESQEEKSSQQQWSLSPAPLTGWVKDSGILNSEFWVLGKHHNDSWQNKSWLITSFLLIKGFMIADWLVYNIQGSVYFKPGVFAWAMLIQVYRNLSLHKRSFKLFFLFCKGDDLIKRIRLPFLSFHSLPCISDDLNKLGPQRNMQQDGYPGQVLEFWRGQICTILASRLCSSGQSFRTFFGGVRMISLVSVCPFTHPCQSVWRLCSYKGAHCLLVQFILPKTKADPVHTSRQQNLKTQTSSKLRNKLKNVRHQFLAILQEWSPEKIKATIH